MKKTAGVCLKKDKIRIFLAGSPPLPAAVSFSALTACGEQGDGRLTAEGSRGKRRDQWDRISSLSGDGGWSRGRRFSLLMRCVLSLTSPHSQQRIEGEEERWGPMRAPQRKQQTTASLYLCSSGLHQRAGISQEATGFTLYCRELKGLKKHRSERRTGGLMEPQTHLLRLHTRRMSSAEEYTQPLLSMCCSSFSLCSYMYVRVGLKEARCHILIGS